MYWDTWGWKYSSKAQFKKEKVMYWDTWSFVIGVFVGTVGLFGGSWIFLSYAF